MRKTKIVCTIGPASSSEEILIQMANAGMNVARLNFSHGSHPEHKERIDTIKRVRAALDLPIAIMLDTKGPEFRIGTFKNKKIHLNDGDTFTFTTEDIDGDDKRVSVQYKGMMQDLHIGDRILLSNGLLQFKVKKLTDTEAVCDVIAGGDLSDRKSMNFPDCLMSQPFLSEQDKKDLLFGIENEVDFIAASFVSRKDDLDQMRSFLDQNGGKDIAIVAKIENRTGVENIEEICSVCNGVLIGRGDMGVEIPFEELPAIQKYLIEKCRMLGKQVITATEMLESMIQNARPTRAEISDVANAVYDETSAIMLSGETAAGKYPVLTVQTMSRIAEEAERNIHYDVRFRKVEIDQENVVDAISHAACNIAMNIHAKAVAVCTMTGKTAQLVSRFRSPVPIIGITTDEKAYRRMALSWNVYPVMTEQVLSSEVMFYNAAKATQKFLNLSKGDRLLLTGGLTSTEPGHTNLIKVETL